MSKLTVVFLKDTGHVLAALTRADPPAIADSVSALVGAGLSIGPVGEATSVVTILEAMLDAVTVDDQPGVTLDPLGFAVVKDPQGLKPPTVTAATVSSGTPVVTKISQAAGALTTLQTSPTASATAVLVLRKVASPSPAPIIVVTTLIVGTPQVIASGFTQHDTWDVYAFVQNLAIVVSPAVAVT